MYVLHTAENELEDSPRMQGVVRSSLALCATVDVVLQFTLFFFLIERWKRLPGRIFSTPVPNGQENK